jgi:hypothetical protein
MDQAEASESTPFPGESQESRYQLITSGAFKGHVINDARYAEPHRLATESESEFEQRLERLWLGRNRVRSPFVAMPGIRHEV